MQPAFDLRIQSMMKALTEAVMPAIDPANKAALEQLHLTLGSLALLRDQLDHAYAFEVADLKDQAALANGLAERVGKMSPDTRTALEAARVWLDGKPAALSKLRDANGVLRAAIADEIAGAYAELDGVGLAKLERWLLEITGAQIGRERAFVAATGFDVFPDTLRPIGELLDT